MVLCCVPDISNGVTNNSREELRLQLRRAKQPFLALGGELIFVYISQAPLPWQRAIRAR